MHDFTGKQELVQIFLYSQKQDLNGRNDLLDFFLPCSPCTIFLAVFAVQKRFFFFLKIAKTIQNKRLFYL